LNWLSVRYYDYKQKNSELNFKDFKKLLLQEGDIGDLGAKTQVGIRSVLLA
jgi:hypothetical protein